ncbi:hypothetical protein HYC85_016439 [Camellia sinensis]|uniref:Uncharacterized protein n=1 Tax=Camellia sinensis TaxID=4442 RepID=A0A7J7H1Y9_CAMSI|nr:hypothetical protein HYC85_016439 [Camellia sinensis]
MARNDPRQAGAEEAEAILVYNVMNPRRELVIPISRSRSFITYRGRHTCIQTSQVTAFLASTRKDCPKQNKYQPHQEEENQSSEFEIEKVKTEELGIMKEKFPSFSFPSVETESENVETNIFPDSLKEKNLLASDSPTFVSLETSESNYYSMLPIQMENFELLPEFRTSRI